MHAGKAKSWQSNVPTVEGTKSEATTDMKKGPNDCNATFQKKGER
jgi:hypothetical protein